jgi:hypothetical protein
MTGSSICAAKKWVLFGLPPSSRVVMASLSFVFGTIVLAEKLYYAVL